MRNNRTLSLFIACALLFAQVATVRATASFTTPVASSFSTTVAANRQNSVQLQGSDAEGTGLTFATTSSPVHGTLSGLNTATGAVVYTPAADYVGADSFSYTVTSGGETSTAGTVTLTVTNAKTRIIDTVTDASGAPLAGKVTFILTQPVHSPGGLTPKGTSVSATLSSSGQFDISVYPSRSLQPAAYYQVYFVDSKAGQTLLGVYDIPLSTSTINLAPYKVLDTNLAAQYTFASAAAVTALSSAVSTASLAQLVRQARTTGKVPYWDGGNLSDSIISQSGTMATVTGNVTATGTITGGSYVGITSAALPTTLASKTLTSPMITGGTQSSPTITSPTITGGTQSAPTITSPAITGGTITGGTQTSPTINTPAITSPAITGGTISGGTQNSPTINTPTMTSPAIVGTVPGNVVVEDTVTAANFVGNGSGLTGILGSGTGGGTASIGSLSHIADSDNTGAGETISQLFGSGGGQTESVRTTRSLFESYVPTQGPVRDKGGQVYNVLAYGANPNDAADDTAAIAAAILAVPAYGELVFPPPAAATGYYKVTSTINITKPIVLRGLGGVKPFDENNDPRLGPPYYNISAARTEGPKLLWAGGASEVIKVYDTEGVTLHNLLVDGANLATYTLMFDTVRHSRVTQSSFVRPTTAALIMGTSVPAVGGNNNNGSRFNVFEGNLFYGPNGVQIKKIGSGGSGAYHNDFYSNRIKFEGASGVGLDVVNGDNNSFHNLMTWNYNGSSTMGVRLRSSLTAGVFDPQGSYNSYFYHLQAIGVTVDADNPYAGVIYGLDTANTANLPVIGTGSRLTYFISGRTGAGAIAPGGDTNGLVLNGSINSSSHINSGGVVTMTGGMASGTVSITASSTITPSAAKLFLIGADAGPNTQTLPPAAGWAGYEITFLKADNTANVVTILGTINGAGSYALSTFGACVTLKAHSSGNWFIIGKC